MDTISKELKVRSGVVHYWQLFLIRQHALEEGQNDGWFGKITTASTIAFQKKHGLEPDGIVGPLTWTKAVEQGLCVDNFYTNTILKSPLFFRSQRTNDLGLLEPTFRQQVEAIIQDAEQNHGTRLVPFETYRSRSRQVKLYNQGASKLKEVGTHHYGLACDLIKVVGGWKGDFTFLGKLAKQRGLVWGGDWVDFPDNVHVQKCSVAQQTSLFGCEWYP